MHFYKFLVFRYFELNLLVFIAVWHWIIKLLAFESVFLHVLNRINLGWRYRLSMGCQHQVRILFKWASYHNVVSRDLNIQICFSTKFVEILPLLDSAFFVFPIFWILILIVTIIVGKQFLRNGILHYSYCVWFWFLQVKFRDLSRTHDTARLLKDGGEVVLVLIGDWDNDSNVSFFIAIRFIFLALHLINFLLDWPEKPNISLLLGWSRRYFDGLSKYLNWFNWNFGNSCLAFSSRSLVVICTYFKNCWPEIALFQILVLVRPALIFNYSVVINSWCTHSWLV